MIVNPHAQKVSTKLKTYLLPMKKINSGVKLVEKAGKQTLDKHIQAVHEGIHIQNNLDEHMRVKRSQ
mgnify:CR=1 FL=1